MKTDILGVQIDKIDLAGILEKISVWLESNDQHYIVTVNAEFIIEAQKNQEFKQVLNQAALAICDGAGPQWAGRFLKDEKLTRVTGVELTEQLLNFKFQISNFKSNPKSEIQNPKFYLLGGREGVAQAVKEKYTQANIVGAEAGGKIDATTYLLDNNDKTLEQINQSGANILLVAFGQMKQEMWIYKNLSKLPNIKVAIGIGGTFDYLSGQIKRAPASWRNSGLEWLYRLITEPKRIKRIWNATIKFGYLVIKEKIKK